MKIIMQLLLQSESFCGILNNKDNHISTEISLPYSFKSEGLEMNAFTNLFAAISSSKILNYLACIFSSLYLTAYIDLYILRFNWSRLLVFGCIFTVCVVVSRAARRFFKSFSLTTMLLSIIAAVLILIRYEDILFPSTQEIIVTLTAETAGEICLCNVIVDGENIPVVQTQVVENSGWSYGEEYDNFIIWPEKDGVDNHLTLRFFADEVHLGFPYTPYAGSVTITSSTGSHDTLDLHCLELSEGESVTYADFPMDCQRIYSSTEQLLYGIGILLIISFLCSFLIHVADLVWQRSQVRIELLLFLTGKQNPDKQSQNNALQIDKGFPGFPVSSLSLRPGAKLAFLSVLVAAHYGLFFVSSQTGSNKITVGFLTILVAISYRCLTSSLEPRLLKKYKTPRATAFVIIIALYASFASFGQRFFLDGNTRIHFSAEGLFILLSGVIWFIPIIYLLLFGLEWMALSLKFKNTSPRLYRHLAFWAMLAILCFIQTIILWSFWPGGFVGDSIVILSQAVGGYNIESWHPPLNAIFYRIILTICPNAGAVVAVQLFFFALLCTKFLMLGYNYGISFKVLALLGILFNLLPNQVISGICPVKDYLYMLALLWETYLLVCLSLNPEELCKWQFLLALALSMFSIYGFRHNGIVPFTASLVLFAWITIRYFPLCKLRLVIVLLSSILMIATYKGPIYSLLHVSQSAHMSPYITMLCAAASCINKDLPLSEESSAIMESVLPLEQWGTYYNRYAGHDPYYWGRGDLAIEYPFDPTQITAREAFSVYLEVLCKYPDVVIKDRLDGADLLWDVRQPTDSFNTKGFLDVTLSVENNLESYFDLSKIEYGVPYRNPSPLSEAYRTTVNTSIDTIWDILLWRSGIYLILLMILVLFWWKNQIKIFLWTAVPLLGEITGLLLVMYHQSFRYVHAIQILTLVLAFCSILLHNVTTNAWLQETT